ncbi:DJ-1 family glyoxalase III [Porphyromonas somerae]|uniref:DJ-1 family glyoxalase III n=1 Tax=Porphyromonas somerae TaxID=322095 RepID=UPI000475B297|nr:DJ-1 family glyoxalase III [Porphyromonas somerae]
MTKKVYIFVANGTEETEAVGTYDTLKRGGIDAYFVSINPTKEFTSSHGLQLMAHYTIEEVKDEVVDAVALPGGMPGATNLYECELLREIITRHLEAGKHIAAMCASPLVFGRMGLLEGKKATAYPGFEEELKGAKYKEKPAVVDGQIITGRGPGYVFNFGAAIVGELVGYDKALEVANGLLITEDLDD